MYSKYLHHCLFHKSSKIGLNFSVNWIWTFKTTLSFAGSRSSEAYLGWHPWMSHQLIAGLYLSIWENSAHCSRVHWNCFECMTLSPTAHPRSFVQNCGLNQEPPSTSTLQTQPPLCDYYIRTCIIITKNRITLHLQSWHEAWKSGSCSRPFKEFPRQNVCCASHSSQPPHSPIKMPFRSLFSRSQVESASDFGSLPTPFSGGLFCSFETRLSLDSLGSGSKHSMVTMLAGII